LVITLQKENGAVVDSHGILKFCDIETDNKIRYRYVFCRYVHIN